MAAHNSGFFNAVDGDRTYSAEELGMMFDGVITDGVFHTYLNAFGLSVGNGTYEIGAGRAWFNHKWVYYDESLFLPFNYPASNVKRIDAIIVHIDNSPAVREGDIRVLTGTASADPVRPLLTNTEYIHEYPLYYVTLNGSTYSHTIDDMRGSLSCPWSASVVEQDYVYGVERFYNIDTTKTSFVMVFNSHIDDVNAPINSISDDLYWNVINIVNSIDSGGGTRVTQLAWLPSSDDTHSKIFMRQKYDDTWYPTGGVNIYDHNPKWYVIDAKYLFEEVSVVSHYLEASIGRIAFNESSSGSLPSGDYYTIATCLITELPSNWDEELITGAKYLAVINLYYHFTSSSGYVRVDLRKNINGTSTLIAQVRYPYSHFLSGGTIQLVRAFSTPNSVNESATNQIEVVVYNETDGTLNYNTDSSASLTQFVLLGGSKLLDPETAGTGHYLD